MKLQTKRELTIFVFIHYVINLKVKYLSDHQTCHILLIVDKILVPWDVNSKRMI